MPEVYRSAASILVLRPSGRAGEFDMLLLHKPRKNDAWQLPQGGVEAGESICEAALRELQEEAGLTGCTVLGESGCVYQYDFPEGFRRFRPDNVRGQRICFITALAPQDARVQVDGKEVDEFVWVTPADMEKYVKRGEYGELVRKLYMEATEKLKTES